MASLKKLESLLMGEFNDNQSFQSGANRITGLANKRTQSLMSKFAATGMSRTGIGGAAFNQVNQQAGESLTNLSAAEGKNKQLIIDRLLGINKEKKKRKDEETGIWDVVGGGLGMLAGSLLGTAGGALGSGLGSKLGGLLGTNSGGGELHIPSIENL